MIKRITLAAVAVTALTGIAPAANATETDGTIYVPSDFVVELSDTRDNGSYEVQETALHIATTGTTGTTGQDKVAEYVASDVALADVGEPTLEYTNSSNLGVPGAQLVVDFDNDGSSDGILVGEPASYGNDWWLNKAASDDVKVGAPVNGGGSGTDWHGTLDQWRVAFPDAVVEAFGFSLGSGVKGEGNLEAINFADTRYTFAKSEVLDACTWGVSKAINSLAIENLAGCVS